MNRMIIDEFVWLHGGRIISRKPKGKGEFVVSNSPLSIGDFFTKFDITLNIQGIEQHMQAVRYQNNIVCWEA